MSPLGTKATPETNIVELTRLSPELSGDEVYWADWAPNGNHVVTTGREKYARLWDVSTGKCFAKFGGHGGVVRHAAYSRDSRFLVTGCDDGAIRIWDLMDNQINPFFSARLSADASPRQSYAPPRQVSISGDSRLIACADFGGLVTIYRLEEGDDRQPLFVFRAQRFYCLAAEFSPTNDNILTCGSEGTAELWQVPDFGSMPKSFRPRPSLVFRGHIASVHNASYSATGERVATASKDGTARIWDAKTGRQTFCTQQLGISLNSANTNPQGV